MARREKPMHNETTKALYEMLPEEDKNDFYHAYIYLKHMKHFAHYAKEAAGLPSKKPSEEIDEGVDEMLKAAIQRLGETSADRDTSTYHLKVVKLADAIQLLTQKEDLNLQTPEKVMPYKQAKDIILKNPDSIAVGECICRATSENPCLSSDEMDVCLFVGDPHASFLADQNPKFRKISQDEAVRILKTAHEKGFVHCAEFKKELGRKFIAICNCCSCCCLGIQMWNLLEGQVPFLAPSGYVAEINDSCTGCGDCVDICKFNAIQQDEDGQQAVIIPEKCMGCGICEDKCPTESIVLKRDASKGAPLDLEELMAQQK
jgi:NAD-dependent dihydropyrimidine dehydrogenase PreA subunit